MLAQVKDGARRPLAAECETDKDEMALNRNVRAIGTKRLQTVVRSVLYGVMLDGTLTYRNAKMMRKRNVTATARGHRWLRCELVCRLLPHGVWFKRGSLGTVSVSKLDSSLYATKGQSDGNR